MPEDFVLSERGESEIGPDDRVLVFSPEYPAKHPMRFRIMDARSVRIATDASHWMTLECRRPL